MCLQLPDATRNIEAWRGCFVRSLILAILTVLTISSCGSKPEESDYTPYSASTPLPTSTPTPAPTPRVYCPTDSSLYLRLRREECGTGGTIYSGPYKMCECKLRWAFGNFSCSDISADYAAIEAIGISDGVESRCRGGL